MLRKLSAQSARITGILVCTLLCSLFVFANECEADNPRANPALKYRTPKSLIQLVSGEEDLPGPTAEQPLPAATQESPAKPPRLEDADEEGVLSELRQFFDDANKAEMQLDGEETEDSNPEADEADEEEDESDEDADDESDEAESDADEDSKAKERKLDPALFAVLPSVRQISINTPVSPGILPENYALQAWALRNAEYQSPGYQRPESLSTTVQWQAPWVAYNPLYFEDVWHERHGYDHGQMQPLISAVQFYGKIPFLPYMRGADRCRECTYSFGLGRPGDCTPHFFTLPKKSKRGFVYQSAYIAGAALLTP